MTREELELLSKRELIELVLVLERQIDEYRRHVGLEERAAGQKQSAAPIFREHGKEPGPEQQQKLRELATRKALRNLDNIHYLERSALAESIARRYGVWPSGVAVQHVLYEAIEALRAIEGQPSGFASHLYYTVLWRACVEKAKGREIAKSVSISERQYYRVLKAATRLVTDLMLSLNLKGWQKSGRKGVE